MAAFGAKSSGGNGTADAGHGGGGGLGCEGELEDGGASGLVCVVALVA